jgi:organic hydroperoxide reductase OsmC/OhrA
MRTKEFAFPVDIEWIGGSVVTTRVEGKEEIKTSSPPVFRGKDATVWSPEDFFVASTASCLAITFQGIADRRELPLHSLAVKGDGVVARRDDGRFGFTRIDLAIEIGTEPGHEELAEEIARQAEEGCLVSVSLDVPISMKIEVDTARAARP